MRATKLTYQRPKNGEQVTVSRVNLQMSSVSGDHAAMVRAVQLLGTHVIPRIL